MKKILSYKLNQHITKLNICYKEVKIKNKHKIYY